MLRRNGVLVGDVVGLGKTLMATALARIFEDDHDLETLIICPKNLVSMWEDYRDQYRLRAKVISSSRVINQLPELRRYRLVIIDESHNLRNREGKRYRVIQDYIRANDSKCILLTATPYNKTYLDLSNQLRLFVEEDRDIGIRPERLLRELPETEFLKRYQCSVRSLAAFEKSEYIDDWRELMRLYLVRRTRSFIKSNYAAVDQNNGRYYLTFEDGSRSYFPERIPRTVKFAIDEDDKSDQYAQLYSPPVVDLINSLHLPRYGLGNYETPTPDKPPTQNETRILQDLSRAGKRLMGFCRTNLFKRLESGGMAFLQSIERHVLRNFVYLHAIENGQFLPLGTQSVEMLDTRLTDQDNETDTSDFFDDEDGEEPASGGPNGLRLRTEEEFRQRAAEVYQEYATHRRKQFKWIRPTFFIDELRKDLAKDCEALLKLLGKCGDWDPRRDTKLESLMELLTQKHPFDKVLVFSQFADTVRYLVSELEERGINALAGATGDIDDPTLLAWRFCPESNNKRDRISPHDELRVLIATDVLSEGQNLQDCAIVVNYDLPWAIIRLVQRAGRVDRIGQKAEDILCYSFLPAEGVERIIRLRSRVRTRLHENAEVVGTDEAFFEDDDESRVLDLYNEKAGILDGDDDSEVDLASKAYQIWKNAIDANPELEKIIPAMPDVVYSTKPHEASEDRPHGVLVYARTAEDNDALAYVDAGGQSISESQSEILAIAKCAPDTPAVPRQENHHELVEQAVKHIAKEERQVGGQLGRPSGARFRTYERLKRYAEGVKGTLFETPELLRSIEEVYRYPLRQVATDTLNRQLRIGIEDEKLAELVLMLREEGRLCIIEEEEQNRDPRIICSMGLFEGKANA